MEEKNPKLQEQLVFNSASGVRLPGSPREATSESPSPPSLQPSDGHVAITRRRTSWSQRLSDGGKDIFSFRSFQIQPRSATLDSARLSTSPHSAPSNIDDFFAASDDISLQSSPRFSVKGIFPPITMYSIHQAGPSLGSLGTEPENDSDEGHREDDEAHLTANMSHHAQENVYGALDPEDTAAMTPRTRKRTVRYNSSPSPLKKTGDAIKSMSNNLRRASVRVVNLGSLGLENQIRLPDDEDTSRVQHRNDDSEAEGQRSDPLRSSLPIRGRTLCCLGPENKIRLSLFNFLVHQWTEPVILVLIFV